MIESAIDSIERNFSGIQFANKTSLEVFKGIFKEMYPCPVTKEYDVLKRIKENINDLNSRYLLVISKSSISTFLLSSIISNEKKEYSFYIGSQFEEDLNKEEYALKVLNKIQIHMERGNILILKNLESVYPNLYDLFNQNFTVLSNKNYARLAVGSNTNTFAYVNNDFRCIVSVDIDKINDEEAPFLNRFEKHIISFEYLLNKELIEESEKIKSILDELIKYKEKIFKGINYDLKTLLINCGIEEVQGLVYQANKEGKKKEEIYDYVFERIALTLPQDIIVNMQIGGFKQNKSKYFTKIIESYNKGEHTNFANFLKKMNNYKNIVYTFSNNLDDIKNINDINNPLIGNIKEDNIKIIKINSIKSENDLESQLDDFLNEDNNKICLIKFLPYEGNLMNYIKYFIEDKEKDYESKPKKIFVFIIYMTRILKEDLKNILAKTLKEQIEIKKKILEDTMSNLSGYYQIFIDNLNGGDKLKIDKILNMRKTELFKNLVNIDEELCANIYRSLSYMKYKYTAPYKGLDQNNYVDKLIEFIYNNKRLRHLINECFFRNLINEDIIPKIFKEKNIFNGDEIEIISVIKRYLSRIYASQLGSLYFKAEKDQLFSTLISNSLNQEIWPKKKIKDKEEKEINLDNQNDEIYEDKSLIEKITKNYLENLTYGSKGIVEREGSNEIEITFGYNIPAIKPVFVSIIKSFKETILKTYKNNEDNLRDDIDKKNIEKQKKKYFEELKKNNNYFNNLILKEQRLNNIINIKNDNEEEKDKLYDLIINDYYTFFLSTNLNQKNQKNDENEEEKILIIDNIDNNKRFLNLMVNLRNTKIQQCLNNNDENKDIILKLATNINWIENYSDDIILLQQMFLKLNMKIPELNEQIENIIKNKEIQYEISERNPEYTSIVNEPFFLSLDSILRVITSKTEIYELPPDDLFDLIKTNNEVLQNALKIEANLFLRSKEVFSLQEILKIVNALYLNNLDSVENVKKIIQYFAEETTYIQQKKEKILCDNLKNFYKFLVDTLGKIPINTHFNFYKTLSLVFVNEFTKITSNKFRELLLQKILENNNFIKNSSQLISIILENVIDSNPEYMINNINSIKEEDSQTFKILNNAKNEFLDEVIMNIFERKSSVYFESIPNLNSSSLEELFAKYYNDNKKAEIKNLTGIIFGNSLKIFKETIQFLDSITKTKDEINENNHLIKLYSIVYVKMYLSKFVSFVFKNSKEIGDITKIIEIINKIKNENFERVIKIYILKLFFNLMNNNFEQFQKYEYMKGIDFIKEFDIKKKDNVKDIMLSFFFLPLDEEGDYKKYSEELSLFAQNNNFDPSRKEIADLIVKDGIDTFLLVSINKVISNLGLNKYEEKETYKKFSNYAISLFSNNDRLKISKNLCNLLFLFYNSQIYINKIKPKIPVENGIINQKIFEILLYGFRYCVNTLDNYNDNKNKNFLYQSILSNDCINTIDQSLIPGNDIKEDMHITSLETINIHFSVFANDVGCYVCSCGYYYLIDRCGFPTACRTFNCLRCGEKCGWGKKIKSGGAPKHGMVVRPGHYRIFKDLDHKESQMSLYNEPDENIPNLILDEYIKKVIEPIRETPAFGFNSVSRDYFENQNKKVRKLSMIGYRLLNLISYYHLFYSYCLGYISEINMKKYLIQNTDIIKIIEIDWDLLKESLQQKNVNSIQIFMNMIFKKLSKLIKECKSFKNELDRENFESQVENLITECLNNYENYSKKYNEKNKNLLELDINSLKTLVTELIQRNEENYPEISYPMFKYFILTKYKSEEDMIKRMNNKEKYPLLNQLITGNPAFKKLSYLPAFNDFTNYMVDNYSFKISRDDAKKRILENEEIYNTKEFTNKFNNFIKAWNEIKSEATKYQCPPEMPIKELSKGNELICFLNDNGEIYNGMHLASACQNFIDWQNSFLQPITEANEFSGILHHYVNNIKKKIPIQDAKHGQIVLIKESFQKSKYVDLNDVIYSFSARNVFNENGKINYSDYNSFVYDYASIEEELGKIILPGVCLFEGESNLNFITFWGEGFRGGKSQTISNFDLKYPQRDLADNEKEIVIQYINKMNKEKMEKYNVKYDFKEFFGSLQMLIFYLAQKGMMKQNEKIITILENAPGYFKLSNDCKNFFYNEGCEIIINKLMNLFFFFEHLCFEDLVDTLQDEYKVKIPDDKKTLIKNTLLNKEKDPQEIITVKDLAAATRRFISRSLAGKLQVTDIREDKKLDNYIHRQDLWEEKITKLDNYEDLVKNKVQDFDLSVGEAYDFYNLIGEEDRNSILNEYKN